MPQAPAAAVSLVLVLSLLASPASAAFMTADWRSCGSGKFEVTGGSAAPRPARPGQEVAFTVDVNSDVEVGGGTLDVQVKYLGFKVYSSSGDLCDGLPCPLPAGPQTLTFKQQLPKVAPPGSYVGVFEAKDDAGSLLFCVDLDFNVALGFGGAEEEVEEEAKVATS